MNSPDCTIVQKVEAHTPDVFVEWPEKVCTIVQKKITVSILEPPEARQIVEEIREHIGSTRRLLFALWEGEGWRALGYANWRECVTAEFEQSQRWCYYQLAAAQVEQNISTIVETADSIPESHLRSLTKLPPERQVEAYQRAIELGGSRLAARHVRAAVAELKAATGKPRTAMDYYPTDRRLSEFALLILQREDIRWEGPVWEPCVGSGDIVAAMPDGVVTLTNDLDPDREADYHLDAADPVTWLQFPEPKPRTIITNPPFNAATQIARNAWQHTEDTLILLLRLSWQEPCADRAEFLRATADHLRLVIPVNPRPDFRDDGGGDQVTVCWHVWQKSWSWAKRGMPSPFQYLTNWR